MSNNNNIPAARAVIDNMLTRRSVRSYTPEPVSEEEIELLARAAMSAPSAKNHQPWEFVMVTDRAKLDALASRLRYAKMLFQAPLAIAVCGRTHYLSDDGQEVENLNWKLDCAAATENILLAANALGLGTCWTAATDEERGGIVVEELNVPEGCWPLCVIAVGHPSDDRQPKDKWCQEKIHRQIW